MSRIVRGGIAVLAIMLVIGEWEIFMEIVSAISILYLFGWLWEVVQDAVIFITKK